MHMYLSVVLLAYSSRQHPLSSGFVVKMHNSLHGQTMCSEGGDQVVFLRICIFFSSSSAVSCIFIYLLCFITTPQMTQSRQKYRCAYLFLQSFEMTIIPFSLFSPCICAPFVLFIYFFTSSSSSRHPGTSYLFLSLLLLPIN